MEWNKRLTAARERKKLSKSAFARLIGVSAPTVTDWENGEIKAIKGENLVAVCQALDITESYLLHGGELEDQAPTVRIKLVEMQEELLRKAIEILDVYLAATPDGRSRIDDAVEDAREETARLARDQRQSGA